MAKPEPTPKPRTKACSNCHTETLLDAEHIAAQFNWITHQWDFFCKPCQTKLAPPVEKKTKAQKGREKFTKLMKSAMRKKSKGNSRGTTTS